MEVLLANNTIPYGDIQYKRELLRRGSHFGRAA